MSDLTQDSMDWTPERACIDAALFCAEHDPDAAFVIMLNKGPDGNCYTTSFRNSGLNTIEAVALLEVVKSDLIRSIRSC